jgi:hypothetical protein
MNNQGGVDWVTVLTPEQQVAAVLARDTRRVRLLTGLTVLVWLYAAAVISFLGFYFTPALVPKEQEMLKTYWQKPAANPDPVDHDKLLRALSRATASHSAAISWWATILAAGIGVLAVAGLGTVLLVFATRRATMRQIQASLADISAQLADLRQKATPPQPGG